MGERRQAKIDRNAALVGASLLAKNINDYAFI